MGRPDAFTPDLAMSLNNQSNQLAGLGRREEALAAIEEAVAIRRELALGRPDAFTPDLAMSLNNQSNQLADLGRREEALAAIEEAAALYRELARARPTVFASRFATSLENQAVILSAFGRDAEAQAARDEAAAVRGMASLSVSPAVGGAPETTDKAATSRGSGPAPSSRGARLAVAHCAWPAR